MNADDLIAFEEDITAQFNAARIKAPVHLAGGNEDELIRIFSDIREADWIFGTWRSHLHCLLKGVPPAEVKRAILDGRSIGLCFPEHRVLCSGIVGGILPIAVGVAWAIKRDGGPERVWCFIGDMAAECGLAHECMKYANNRDLPICFVIEDNGIGGSHTVTREIWGTDARMPKRTGIVRYGYDFPHPHVGTGRFVRMV